MVGSEIHVRNATERIIAVQRQFMVIEGRWFWYKSKARTQFFISDQQQLWSYLAPIRRYGGLLVENLKNCQFLPNPSLISRPRSGWPLSNFVINQIFPETGIFGSLVAKKSRRYLSSFRYNTGVWQTDRQTDICSGYISACIHVACYANALVTKC